MIEKIPIKYFLNKNMCVIGSSHALKDIDLIIERTFNKFGPQLVVLELDKERYNLISNLIKDGAYQDISSKLVKNNKNPELNQENYLDLPLKDKKSSNTNKKNAINFMNQIRTMQMDLGQQQGLIVGLEFFKLIELSTKNNIPIELIDISVEEVIQKIQGIEEGKLSQLVNEFNGHESSDLLAEFNELTSRLNDLDYINDITQKFKEESPELYKIFIEDRNKQMVDMVNQIIEKNPNKKILVLIGAGHLPFFLESFTP